MTNRWGIAAIAGILVAGLVIGLYLFQQSKFIGKEASGTADTQLVCDAGTDPYNSHTITVKNNTSQTVSQISSNVFRCEYSPNKVRVGYYKCEDDCTGDGPDCQEGLWDPAASQDFSLAPGETKTVTVTANPCEIVQIDTQNDETHVADDPTECYNIQSQHTNPAPPNRWPGGIAFGISQNSSGYNTSTGSCDVQQPTPQPTTPQPTTGPTNTPIPTTPPGVPTYTPVPTPTNPFTPTNTPAPFVPTNTSPPQPTQPVTGAGGITTLGIVGGVGLLLLTIL
jgi:hypothetical protein